MPVELASEITVGQKPHHILEAQQFSPDWLIQDLFPMAFRMELKNSPSRRNMLPQINGFNLFYEASTRTRTSFAQAIRLMGGHSEGTENARAFSSVTKGESLEDTVRILNGYEYDYIVLRYDKEGGAKRAATVSEVPIINAGDGTGQHPTQALLDVYTIYKQFGRLEDLRVTMVGDLERGRTVHSLAYVLSKFPGIRFDFASPSDLRIKPDLREYLERHNIPFTEDNALEDILPIADVVYMTRQQLERDEPKNKEEATPEEIEEAKLLRAAKEEEYKKISLNRDRLNLMKPNSIVMHPLPRNSELPFELDDDPRIVAFEQAKNGLYIRMALLYMIFNDH